MSEAFEVKVEVTVNGSGFDTPSTLSIKKDGDIPTCNMKFPGGKRSRFRILKTDLIEVFIGLGEIPDFPIFQGYLEDESGFSEATLEALGPLSWANREIIIVDEYDNFNGYEISDAVGRVLSSVSALSGFSYHGERTNPRIIVPPDKKWNKGITKYDLIRQFRDWAVDNSNPPNTRGYCVFSNDGAIYFKKEADIDTTPPLAQITYGKDIITISASKKGKNSINRQKVIGANGVRAEYSNAQRILIDGIREEKPISNSNITTVAEALGIARGEVLKRLTKQSGVVVRSHKLLNAEPNVHTVEILDAPYGLSGKYIIRSVDVSIGQSSFEVTANMNTPTDVIGASIKNLLSLDRDYEQSA